MARGFPSMTALLGLLAVAGFQNRDKIAEYLRGAGASPGEPGATDANPAAGQSVGGFLQSSIGELVNKFRQTGLGAAADSWVSQGPNQAVSTNQLEQSLGPEMIEELSQRAGLSKQEILARLAKDLPSAVDSYTPHGRLPTERDA